MALSRREALIAGGALAAVPLIGAIPAAFSGETHFPTGNPEIDRQIGGGMRLGTLLVVVGPRESGKTDFLVQLARTNGILDGHAMNHGGSDMLSIMRRGDGQYIGSIVMNNVEPSTDKERSDMLHDPRARDTFLSRWFSRSKAILQDSGGIFALTVEEPLPSLGTSAEWIKIPDYVIAANDHTCRLIRGQLS